MTRLARSKVCSTFLQPLGPVFVLMFALAVAASAQTGNFTVLYSFHGATGAYPLAAPIVDADGNVYGTTQNGGNRGFGTVYEITSAGDEIVLHSFKTAPDGNFPVSSLVQDSAGNLYGTTTQGGNYGFGTVFEVTAAGKESVLYSFTGTNNDGRYPSAGLVFDASGNLYGTTQSGGKAGFGTVFKLDGAGTETVLYSFKGYPNDGEYPIASLTFDDNENLYGTTELGGRYNNGTIFELVASGKEKVIFSLTGDSGGGYPFGGVVRDDAGNLYSTAAYGGRGIGTVFKVNPKGVEIRLYAFNGGNGAYPSAGLVRDAEGNLYGTTEFGGPFGAGVIFEIKGGTEIILHSLDGADGSIMLTGLGIDKAGNLYGVATQGGTYNQGTVFKLTP